MTDDLTGDMIALIATAYFFLFGGLVIAAGIIGRRYEQTPPVMVDRRVRLAVTASILHFARVIWFIILCTLALTIPTVQILQLLVVYGGAIAVTASTVTATEWALTAVRQRAAAKRLAEIAVVGGYVFDDLVEIRAPRALAGKILTGAHLDTVDVEALQLINPEGKK